MADEKKPAEKMVRIQYNKEQPHKIGAHPGDDETKAQPSITLRQGLNHVRAAAWEQAKKLPVVQHHLNAKVVPAVRDGKHVLVPLIEELGEAKADEKPAEEPEAKKKADADAKKKAEAEEAERQRAAAEAKEEADAKKKAEAERGGQSRR
jgi:colicin import membrane protein